MLRAGLKGADLVCVTQTGTANGLRHGPIDHICGNPSTNSV